MKNKDVKSEKSLVANSKNGGGFIKKRKKAFTLIELLAIIVILAIIAVITVPIILNIIENSKKGAATDSAYGYKDAVNKWYVSTLQEDNQFQLASSYTISSDGKLGDIVIPISGDKPSGGYLNYSNNTLTGGCLVFGDYAVTFDGNDTTTEKGDCSPTNPYLTTFDGNYTYGYKNITFGSTSTLDPSWGTYLRNDGEKSELCVVFTGGTVCVEQNRWDCGEVIAGHCSNSDGYIANKIAEIESAGATCNLDSGMFCQEEPDGNWHQIMLFTQGYINSEYYNGNDAIGCWFDDDPRCYESN